jgi:hypothetical protein
MGEQIYEIKDKFVSFQDSDDEFSCLCLFPPKDERLEIDKVKSLALFGAVVRLILDGYYDDEYYDNKYIYIPLDVPEWILNDIRRIK